MSTLKREPHDTRGCACPWLSAGPGGRGLALDDYPSVLLMRVSNLIQLQVTSVYAKQHALTVPEWRLLARLCESAPMQLAALCRTSFFDKAYAGRVLRSLEQRGLVALTADRAHKRRMVVDITSAGRELARQVLPVARRGQMRLLEALEPVERTALYTTLHKLMAATAAPPPLKGKEKRAT
jgi:MarR family transcriptional regulator, organic hydroperoxide resistance regulator